MTRIALRLFIIGTLMVGLSAWILQYVYERAAAGDQTVTLSAAALSQESGVAAADATTKFSLRGRDGDRLYKPRQTGAAGVYEFLNKKIRAEKDTKLELTDLLKKLEPVKTISDQDDPVLQGAGKAANRTHYFFRQKVNDLEVFGSQVTVHQQDNEDIYAFEGTLVHDQSLEPQKLTEDQAQIIALNKVHSLSKARAKIKSQEKVAVNPGLIGVSSDTKTYPAIVVTTNQETGELTTPRRTIVSLTDGAIIQSIEMVDYAMNRMVYNCKENPTGQCALTRQEGSVPSGETEPDSMYTFLGEIYDFYKVKMNRDSFNNAGATMRAFVNLPAELAGEKLCPNARWVRGNGPTDNQLQTCPGWNTRDIDAHEFTHGVVEYTANLDFLNQSGALNEAIADVFAMGVDPDDWQLGEDLTIGAIRHVNDPGQNRSANSSGGTSPYPMPDRLFSPLYFCEEGDRGGVHINMTIPTKAFYLMVAGGTFNGCTMTPVARDKVLLVWYQALTKYLGQTSNFRNLYDGMVQGCTELYGATSNECVQIKKSMEAVELDQQPLGEQKAPVCRNVTAAAPSCVGTENPVTPSPNVTGIACSNVEGDATGDGKVNLADYQTWRREFTK